MKHKSQERAEPGLCNDASQICTSSKKKKVVKVMFLCIE